MTAFRRPDTAPGATSEQDDSVLVARVVEADSGALKELYERHAPWLQARLMRRCNDREVVADVLQDTFVALWKDARRFRHDGEVGAWLWGIAFRRMVSRLRSRRDLVLIPDWDVLSEGWSSTAWIEGPQAPVVDIRIPDATITAGPSRFV